MDSLHPDLASLAFLLGTWEGHGTGIYPTVDGFTYRESSTFFAPHAKPFIVYQQKTWRGNDHPGAESLHAEAGYLRPSGTTRVEMVLTQPTGIVEVLHGQVADGKISLKSTLVGLTDTAKRVETVERNISVDGDIMKYELLMSAMGESHQVHLEARLERAR